MNRRALILGLGAAAAAALAVCAHRLHFTQYMAYDDEGYVLWSYLNYFAHGGLYTQVYSQYGPFPYVLYHLLGGLTGWTMDSELVRWLNLGYWLGCSGLAGWFVWRQTRSAGAAGAGAVLTFLSLLVMISEPGHPGGLLALLAGAGAVGAAVAIEHGRPRTFAVVTALAGAMMVLGKINVGLFFLLAAGSWLALHTPLGRARRGVVWLVALGAAASPLALMAALRHEQWVMIFGFVFAAGALALLLLMMRQETGFRSGAGPRDWAWGAGAFLLMTAAVTAAVWFRGTPPAELWRGMVLEPLRHPLVYVHPLTWPAAAPWLALGGLLLALSDPRWAHHPARGIVLALARLAAVAWLLWRAPGAIDFSLSAFGLKYGAPLVWLMAVPLQSGTATPAQRARTWLAWVFLWQTLQAYPVAGSQTAWGGFLWMPLAIAGAHEAMRHLADRLGTLARPARALGALTLAAACSFSAGRAWAESHVRWALSEPLGIPGAARLRLTDDYTVNLRVLTRNIAAHADTLFSYPGLFSFNAWTGRPTPTLANVTHWFSLLDDSRQHAIIARLEADPRAVVLVQSYLINFLVVRDLAPRGPLHDHLLRHYEAAFRVDTYEFWVRRGRTVAPLGTARLRREEGGDWRLEAVTDATGEVARLEVQTLFEPLSPLVRTTVGTGSPWNSTPLTPAGTPAGETREHIGAVRLGGITRLELTLPPPSRRIPPLDYLRVVLYDRAGRPVETLRFSH